MTITNHSQGPTVRRRTTQIVFVNDSSGTHTDVPDCLKKFERREIAEAAALLPQLLADSDSAARLLVAVWGGDGTIRSVAALLVDSPATLLPCPGGTHNHFCRTLGLDDESHIEMALASGEERLVDVGTVASEVFLNNLSIGWYTDLVARRERYEAHVSRRVAKVASVIMQLFRTRRVRLTIDGVPERIWLFWVGNNEYEVSSTRLTERRSIDEGVLDVRLLRAGDHWPKVRAFFALLSARGESSPSIVRRLASSTTAIAQTHNVRAALDGEVVTLASPIQVQVHRRALRVLVPPTKRSSAIIASA